MAGSTISDWLTHATRMLEQSGISSARLDALVLLEDALDQDRASLLAHMDSLVANPVLLELEKQLVRRASHEPLAYIRGRCEFYGRIFQVSHATLQPRPETETMIDLLKSLQPKAHTAIADIGTGSGAIAITAKLELPRLDAYATEIQPSALDIAHKNALDLSADITFSEGDLLQPLKGKKMDIILANLPYVPADHTINQAAMQEPAIAIFGGQDGLDLYRQLFDQLDMLRKQPAHILTESLPFQHEDLADLARKYGYKLAASDDFIQVFTKI